MITSAIIGTGSCIPDVTVSNDSFLEKEFFEKDGSRVAKENAIVIEKFREITGIAERRYARPEQKASDLGFIAALDAITDAGIDKETLNYIIVAHNFGDVAYGSNHVDTVPSLASRIKALLKISNPDCVAYDIPFGCPGWVEALIQANYYIRSGDAKRCLVIGTETLSRVIDPHDRDSMIYSDGAGAVVVEASQGPGGIIAHKTRTFATEYASLLNMGSTYSPTDSFGTDLFIKMNGRKVYEFALSNVPVLIKDLLDQAHVSLDEVKKVFIHQANGKMDEAILQRIFKLFGKTSIPHDVMPMTISWLGNSSVATVPTLLDLTLKGKMPGHEIKSGDIVLFASVGAGMNINAVLYRL